jgi:hypothetical protein
MGKDSKKNDSKKNDDSDVSKKEKKKEKKDKKKKTDKKDKKGKKEKKKTEKGDKKDKKGSSEEKKEKKQKKEKQKTEKKKDKSPKKDTPKEGRKVQDEAARESQADQLRKSLALKKRVVECWEKITKDPTGKKVITSPAALLEVLQEAGFMTELVQHAGQRREWRIADGRQVSSVHLHADTKAQFAKMLFGMLDLDGNSS